MPSNTVPFNKPQKIFRTISSECGLRERRVFRGKVSRPRVKVGEVTSAASGNSELLADARIALEHGNGPSALAGLDRAQQSRRSAAHNNDVCFLHTGFQGII